MACYFDVGVLMFVIGCMLDIVGWLRGCSLFSVVLCRIYVCFLVGG